MKTDELSRSGWIVSDFQDVKDLLQHVCEADSAQEVQQFGTALVQRLRLAQQRKNDITAQEMKAVMEERDKSVDKVSLSVLKIFWVF